MKRSQDAFAQHLIEEWQAPIYNYALAWLRQPSDAEDATQEIFIAILRDRRDLRSTEALRAWIYRLASRVLIKHKQRARRHKQLGQGREALLELAADPRPSAEAEEQSRALRLGVAALPDRVRAAVMLKYFQGLTQQEVAEALALPRSTVRSRIKKGLELLRRSLSVHGAALTTPRLEALLASSSAAPVPSSLSSSLLTLSVEAPTRAALITGGLMTTKLKTGLGIVALALIGLALAFSQARRGSPRRSAAVASSQASAAESPVRIAPAVAARVRRLDPPLAEEVPSEPEPELPAAQPEESGAPETTAPELAPPAAAEEPGPLEAEPKRAAPSPAREKAGPFPGLISDKSLWITVVDEINGEPIDGAQVYLKPAEISTDEMQMTEARGGRLLINLTKAGAHKLQVYADGYIAFDCELTRGPRSTVGRVMISEELFDRGLTVRLVRGTPVTGLVRDADHKPLEATVTISEVHGVIRGCLNKTRTREGRFKFKGLYPGLYEIAAKAPGHPPATKMIRIRQGSAPRAFILTAGRPLEVRGQVLGADGLPISGARIEAVPTSDRGPTLSNDAGLDSFEGHRALATSDAEGRFALPGLQPGKVDVVVLATGFEGVIRKAITVPGGDPRALEFRLRPGGTIAGRAVDNAGEPLKDTGVWLRLGDMMFSAPWTDSSGRFRFEGLPPGPYQLLATRAGGPWIEVDGLTPGDREIEVLMGPALKVVGQVETPPGGPKVESLRCSAFSSAARVEDDGSFSVSLRKAAPRELILQAEGYLPLTLRDLEVEEGRPLVLKVKLRQAAAVSGTVVDSSGRPEGGVLIRAKDVRGRRTEVSTDSFGRFRFPELEPGDLTLEVRWTEGQRTRISRLPLEVFDGLEIKDLILRLE